MKKILKHFLAIAVILAAVCLFPVVSDVMGEVKASALVSGNFVFNEHDDGTLYISGYNGKDSPTSLTLPSSAGGKKVTAIGSNAFNSISSSLKTVKVPGSITVIDPYAFEKLTALEKVELGSGVTSIGESAFYGCTKLTSVNLPNTVKTLGEKAFLNCSSLTTITLPSSLTKIEQSVFRNCTNLATINFPTTIKEFKSYAFDETAWLKAKRNVYSSKLVIVNQILVDGQMTPNAALTLPNTLEGIADMAFNCNTNLKSIVIPGKVKSIGLAAFTFCKNLENVTIPSSVTHIGGNAFDETKWLENQQKKSPFVIVNGMLINGDACKGAVTIPSSVKKIGEWAFAQNRSITSLSIPSSVTSMEDRAFGECSSLKTVSIASGLTNISEKAFDSCKLLEKINIPSTVRKIGVQAFYYCNSLKSITIPNSVTEIKEAAFYHCDNAASLTLPTTSVKISTCAFGYCTSLKSLTVPAKVTFDGVAQFVYLTSLTNLTLQEGLTSIPDYAFQACSKLTNLKLANSIKVIGNDAFSAAPLSAELKLPKNLEKIGSYAFAGCTNVKKLCIYDKVKTIGSYAVTPIESDMTIRCYKGSAADTFAKGTEAKIVYFTLDADRVAGSNRYETAEKIASYQFTGSAANVVIASGVNYADALAGVPLAAALKAPILLCDGDSLNQATVNKIKELKSKKVYILGGTGAVSANVEKQLKSLGLTTERAAGKNRFETAVNIAKTMAKVTNKTPTSVFVVYSNNYPDAISAGPAAAATGSPILYIAGNGEPETQTANYLKSIKSGLKDTYIVGGYGIITQNADTRLKAYATNVTRLYGSNRYSTCIAINNKFAGSLNSDRILVATGQNYPDALCAGVMAALSKSPIFLADSSLNSQQTSFLAGRDITKMTCIGGKAIVPYDMVYKISAAIKAGW